ncbi:MAG: hypothetical protein JW751_19060, partial [Polyangiaceae bacterium]|nr:hypothetical protein [Polyangiaceae bacterium]
FLGHKGPKSGRKPAKCGCVGSRRPNSGALTPVRPVVYLTRATEFRWDEVKTAAEQQQAERDVASTVVWLGWGSFLVTASQMWSDHRFEAGEKPWFLSVRDLVEDLRSRGIRARSEMVHFPMPSLDPLPDPPDWLLLDGQVGAFGRLLALEALPQPFLPHVDRRSP